METIAEEIAVDYEENPLRHTLYFSPLYYEISPIKKRRLMKTIAPRVRNESNGEFSVDFDMVEQGMISITRHPQTDVLNKTFDWVLDFLVECISDRSPLVRPLIKPKIIHGLDEFQEWLSAKRAREDEIDEHIAKIIERIERKDNKREFVAANDQKIPDNLYLYVDTLVEAS